MRCVYDVLPRLATNLCVRYFIASGFKVFLCSCVRVCACVCASKCASKRNKNAYALVCVRVCFRSPAAVYLHRLNRTEQGICMHACIWQGGGEVGGLLCVCVRACARACQRSVCRFQLSRINVIQNARLSRGAAQYANCFVAASRWACTTAHAAYTRTPSCC